MSFGAQTAAAAFLAGLGTVAIYVGVFLNMAALGSTLGYVTIFSGLLLLAAATLPLRSTSKTSATYVAVAVVRYLSLPVFVLGLGMLLVSAPSMLAATGEVRGVGMAIALTIAGLVAVLWPEAVVLWNRLRGRDA